MQRLWVVLVLGGMVMLGLYFISNKPVPVPAMPPAVRPQSPAINPVAPPAANLPAAPVSPNTRAVVPAPNVNPNLGRYQYLTAGKVKIDMNLLARSAGFQAANPKITLEDMVKGRAGPDRVVIPLRFPVTYEIPAKCTSFPAILDVTRVHKRWLRAMNIFIDHLQERAETVAQMGARLQNEKCVKQVTVNNIVSGTNSNGAPDPAQMRLVQETVQKLVARRQTPHFVLIGAREAIMLADPSLTDLDEDGKPHDSPGFFNLNGKNVPVLRRAVLSREAQGLTNSSRISMSLARAAHVDADIIIVDQEGFDRKDCEGAIAFATAKGAIVVTNVPVPPPEPAFAREAAKRREQRNMLEGRGGGEEGRDGDGGGEGGENKVRRGGGGGGGGHRGGGGGGGRRGQGGGRGGGGKGGGKSGGAKN